MDLTLQLTIDCSDPPKMVPFWAEALLSGARTGRRWEFPRRSCRPGPGTGTAGVVPGGSGAESGQDRWPFALKVGGGRDGPLDVRAGQVKSEVDRLVEAGATVLRINDEPDRGLYAAAMQDPEGDEFDIVG
ncbi:MULTISPECIES: VOC family protein [Actinomycetes]|uniref:VOC family protein n=1 Tax=Actinomycetes TaxID=1760 RepID=UPI00131A2699|nr:MULTISPECIES: VOC family protein [Actinomycetes]